MALFSRGERADPELLASTALFDGLPEDDLGAVAKLAKKRTVDKGETLIDQGRYGQSFYVIAEGSAAIYAGEEYVTSVGPATAVGEMALVEHRPRSASVVAESELVVAEFGIPEFNKLMDRYPTTRLRVMELLNARLAENIEREDG